MNKPLIIGLAAGIAGLALGAMISYSFGFDAGLRQNVSPSTDVYPDKVTNFDDCVLAGYPVLESYPRQCRDSQTGILYIENLDQPQPPDTNVTSSPALPPVSSPTTINPEDFARKDGCMIGGCSGQLCGDVSDIEGLVTTCEFRAEYACYKHSTCERQASGSCGWVQTPELMSCLVNPPPIQ